MGGSQEGVLDEVQRIIRYGCQATGQAVQLMMGLEQDGHPGKVIELLARPRLTDLPENPVGRIAEDVRSALPDFTPIELPEILDFAAVRQ